MLLLFWNGYLPAVTPEIQQYQAKLTSEYQYATNELAWLGANIQLFQDALLCARSFDEAFDINTAVGPQLDVLGVIIGQSRTVGFQPSGGVSPVLDDATYRLLLRARILQNHWVGTIPEILQIWKQLFPSGILLYTDNQDMSVTIVVGGPINSIQQDLVTNDYILPRPQGVKYNITYGILPILGFDRSDAFVAGVDLGHFI